MTRPAPTSRLLIDRPAGAIDAVVQSPESARICAVAVVAHPHPLFGGTMDNKVVTTMARTFVDAGAVAWRFNFRGVGKSEGTHADGLGETEDMQSVIEFAQRMNPGLPLWLSGFSFGGAVTLAVSQRTAATEMILIAPAFQRLAQWPSVAGATEEVRIPDGTLLIHGEHDETVPLADSLAWARPRGVPVAVVPGADHFFHQRLHLIRQIASRWLPQRT